MEIELVLVDIDGTLLNDQGRVGQKTKEALAKLKEHNILLGIATGRTPYAVKHLIYEWGLSSDVDLIMGFNGGSCLDLKTNKMVSCDLLAGKYLPQIHEDFKQFNYNAGIYDKESFHALREDERVLKIARANKLPLIIDDLTSYYQKDVEKMLLISDEKTINQMNAYYQTLSSRNYRAVKSTPILLEFLNPELSKSKGIKQICKQYHISPNKVLTFGDELNDLEMIRDYLGVAMANANPLVKEVATYLTKSNNEDGIADFLNKYVFK